MLSGGVRIKWGDHLEKELEIEPGDMLYVPPRGDPRGGERLGSPSPPSTSSPATRRTRTR